MDRDRLLSMGYTNVFQCSAGASGKRGENTNGTVMDYLKKVVPRMFQVCIFVGSSCAVYRERCRILTAKCSRQAPLYNAQRVGKVILRAL